MRSLIILGLLQLLGTALRQCPSRFLTYFCSPCQHEDKIFLGHGNVDKPADIAGHCFHGHLSWSGLFAFWDGTHASLPLHQSRSEKKGRGDVGIAPGNRLLATDHGLTGFPDLKVNPGLGL